MTHDINNRAQGRKKSSFPRKTVILSGASFDYVAQGTNFSIIDTDFFNALGVIGTIVQAGDPTATPILDKAGTVNSIRNLEDGPGVKSSVSPENGVTVEHNFQSNTAGVALLTNPTADSPIIENAIAGTGIGITKTPSGVVFSSTSAPVSTRTVVVSQMSDFPTPVDGVITLESNTDYLIVNDLTTSDRFVMADGSVIRGTETVVINLIYTGSVTLFTGVDVTSQVKDLTITAATGEVISFTDTVFSHQFQMASCRTTSCVKIGSIDGMQQVRIDGSQWDDVQTNGIEFFNACGLFLFDTQLADVNGGSLVDLGTATFNGISLISPFIDLAVGTHLITGAASSANLNAESLGSIVNSRLIGLGTPLDVISVDDDNWFFAGNDGIPDTRPDGLLSITAQYTQLISLVNTPVKITGPWTVERQSQTTADTTGRVTYTALRDAVLPADVVITASAASGSNKTYNFYLATAGTVISGSVQQIRLSAGDPKPVPVIWQQGVIAGGFLEVFVENITDATDVVIHSGVIRAN